MAALTKEALRAEKAIRHVSSTLHENRDVLGEGITQILQPYAADGTTVPQFEVVADLLVSFLQDLRRGVVQADLTRFGENVIDSELRSRRDQASAELYGEIVALKGTVRSAHGPEGVRNLGFAAELGRDPVQVLGQTELLLGNLGKPLPPPKVAGTGIDPEAVKQSLEPKFEALRAVLDLLDLEQKETVTAQLVKNSTLADFRRIIANLARTTVGLFRLIGRDDIADRIPRAVRRGTRRGRDDQAPEPKTPPASEDGAASS